MVRNHFFVAFRTIILLTLIVFLLHSCSYKKKLTATSVYMPEYYASGMVMQQKEKLVFYGRATPNTTLGVRIENVLHYTNVDAKGNWRATFPAINYKGEIDAYIEGTDTTIVLKEIKLGDVYLFVGDGFNPKKYNLFEKRVSSSGDRQTAIRVYNHYAQGKWMKNKVSNLFPSDNVLYNALQDAAPANETEYGILNFIVPPVYSGEKRDSLFYVDSLMLAKVQDVKFNDIAWKKQVMPALKSDFISEEGNVLWFRKKVYLQGHQRGKAYQLKLGGVSGLYSIYFNDSLLRKIEAPVENLSVSIPKEITTSWLNVLSIRAIFPDSLSSISSVPVMHNVADSNDVITLKYGWKRSGSYEGSVFTLKKNKNTVLSEIRLPVKKLIYISGYWEGEVKDYKAAIVDSSVHESKVFYHQGCTQFPYQQYQTFFDSLGAVKSQHAVLENYRVIQQKCTEEKFNWVFE